MHSISLNLLNGPILDQGNLNTCNENQVSEDLTLQMRLAGHPIEPVSRLQLYSSQVGIWASVHNGGIIGDTGSVPESVYSDLMIRGVAPESMWAYDPAKFAVRPPDEVFVEAAKHKLSSYTQVNTWQQASGIAAEIKSYLAQGKPVLLNFTDRSWFHDESGPVETQINHYIPGVNSDEIVGHHSVLITKADDALGIYSGPNSWGTGFGDQGYFSIRYDQFANGTGHVSDIDSAFVFNGFNGIDLKWTPTRETAAKLYACVLDRAGDQQGTFWWADVLAKGTSLADTANGFLNTDEGKIKFPASWSSMQVADQLYQQILGRHADATGGANLAANLDHGWTKGDAAALLIHAIDAATGAEHDLLTNRTQLSEFYAVSMQGQHTDVQLVGVTSDAASVEAIKQGWFAGGL